jgi:hypothetical protein
MSDKLQDKVLVLNRKWKPIEESTVSTALCDIVRGAATAIDTEWMTGLHLGRMGFAPDPRRRSRD